VITARTALLLALREGPGYGRELLRRLRLATAGRMRFAEGSIYPALHKLEDALLVRSWTVVPGRRPGDRARTYYELTELGVRVSEAHRADLLRVAAGLVPRLPDADERARMRRRIDLGAELSHAAGEFRVRPGKGRRGRAA